MSVAHDLVPPPTRTQVGWSVAVGVAATTLVALIDPHDAGHYPGCPLLWATGLYCPFCGGLRAVHDLTHLHVAAALDRNPLVVVALPLVLLAWLAWAQRAFTGRRLGRWPTWLPGALLVLLLCFALLRNIPGWTWLSPA